MAFYFFLAVLATVILFVVYLAVKKLSRDNVAFHLLLAIVPSFLIQSLGFLIYDIKNARIDTVNVYSVRDSFLAGSIAILIFSIIASFLVLSLSKKEKINYRNENIKVNRLYLICLVMGFLALVGVYSFARAVGSDFISLLTGSSKWLIASSNQVVQFESNGYARALTTVGTPAFLFFIAYLIVYKIKINFKLLALGSILFAFAVIPPMALSARGGFLYVIVSVLMMLFIAKKLNFKYLTAGILSILVIFSALTASRFEEKLTSITSPISYAIESRVFYGGGISLFNTSIILNSYLNTDMSLKYGIGYAGLITALIPRSVWPNKPVFAYDQMIATDVYKLNTDGAQAIPAGLIGESIINFGVFFSFIEIVFSLSFLIYIHNKIIRSKKPFLSLIFRGIIFPKFIGKMLASGLGFAVMDAVVVMIPLLVLYYFSVSHETNK